MWVIILHHLSDWWVNVKQFFDWNQFTNIAAMIAAVASALAAFKSNKVTQTANHIAGLEYTREQHEQTRKIAVWLEYDPDGNGQNLILNNASDMPIYDVYAGAELAYQGQDNTAPNEMSMAVAEPSECTGSHSLGTVPPGLWRIKTRYNTPGMGNKLGAILLYRDINNDTWFINAQGRIHNLNKRDIAESLDLYQKGYMPHGDEPLIPYAHKS